MKSWHLINLTVTDLASPAGDPFYGEDQEVCSYVFFGDKKGLVSWWQRKLLPLSISEVAVDVYRLTSEGEKKHEQFLSEMLKNHYYHKPEENGDN